MSTIDTHDATAPARGELRPECIRLNIGGGPTPIPGYYTIDRLFGDEAYPLDFHDESVDEVYASHVLEHMGHREWPEALNEWVRVLKPGGVLRIAVPDVPGAMRYYAEPHVAAAVAAGNFPPLGSVLMGGQTDENDYHKSAWNSIELVGVLRKLGLLCIRPFRSFAEDCSRYPFSANFEGRKPTATLREAPNNNIALAMSVPRLGFNLTAIGIMHSILAFNVEANMEQGAYFDLSMEHSLKKAIATGRKYICTVDYDTVFDEEDMRTLTMMMDLHPEFDCIAATQMRRGERRVLLGDGSMTGEHDAESFAREVVPVQSAHFGLTMFRSEAFGRMKYPWMRHRDEFYGNGDWLQTIEADIVFWQNWKAAGNTLGVSPRVKVGHPEETIVWPDEEFHPVAQSDKEYRAFGRPEGTR